MESDAKHKSCDYYARQNYEEIKVISWAILHFSV